MTRTKRMMALALHTSTTDRLGPAHTLAAPGSCLHSMLSRLLPILVLPSLLFFQFLPRGPSGLPSLGDEPLASELASRHHASRTTAHPQPSLCNHLSAPFSCSFPERPHYLALGFGLRWGAEMGDWGQKATVMVGMMMCRGWARWLKTHKKMFAVPGGDSSGS